MTRSQSFMQIRTRVAKLTVLVLVLAVAGCGWAEWPPRGYKPGYKGGYQANQQTRYNQSPLPQNAAPISQKHQKHQKQSSSGGRDPAVAPLRGGGEVQVASNDTVYAISRRYDVSMRAIINANRLQPPYVLYIGQRLTIPAVREHRVRQGETLNAIAQSYGLSVFELARSNHLRSPYRVFSGQKLVVAQAVTPQRSASSARSPAVSTGSLPQVQESKVRATRVSRPEPKAAKKTTAHVSQTKPTETKPQPQKKSAVQMVRASPNPSYRRTQGFIWPLRGRLISGFGAKAKGLHNDGINIVAPLGAPVRAAKEGVVVYAGNELRGFGNLLLIKHTNGWVTAYAHNDKLMVKRGDKVGKGHIIARVGQTGAVTRPQLHFEMRRGKRPVDPKRYLRKARTSS